MSDESSISSDEQLVLRDIRALLDQLQLDRDHTLTMHSRLTDDLGVDSLALVELCDQLERTFDVSLPDEVFLTAVTPQLWLDSIISARSGYVVYSNHGDGSSEEASAITPASDRVIALTKRLMSLVRERRRSSATTGSQASTPGSILYALYAWFLLIPFALSIWTLAVIPLPVELRRRVGLVVARALCRALGISVAVEGELPSKDLPSIIAANHSSFIDGIVLYVFLDQPLTFVSSSDMEHQFLLGRIMRGFGGVFVDRGRAATSAASVETLLDTIRSGHHVLIFPEGSISAEPGLRVFRLGAFETATSSKCPVVPVGISGSREVLPAGSYRPRPGAVHVRIGSPIVPTGTDFIDRVELRDLVREEIARLSGDDESSGYS